MAEGSIGVNSRIPAAASSPACSAFKKGGGSPGPSPLTGKYRREDIERFERIEGDRDSPCGLIGRGIQLKGIGRSSVGSEPDLSGLDLDIADSVRLSQF
jgi:hypothetical protein